MAVMAIVPLRAGSKGLPDKNIRPCAGRPLYLWTVLAALEASRVDQVVVTTDYTDLELPEGVIVVRRPPELADDKAPLDEAVIHAIDELKFDGTVVVLQPTVPVRSKDLIDECLKCFQFFYSANSLVTMNPLHFVWDGETGNQVNPPRVNRQDMEKKLYHEDGSVYITHADTLRETRDRTSGPTIVWETPRTVDVDTEADFALAEFLLGR